MLRWDEGQILLGMPANAEHTHFSAFWVSLGILHGRHIIRMLQMQRKTKTDKEGNKMRMKKRLAWVAAILFCASLVVNGCGKEGTAKETEEKSKDGGLKIAIITSSEVMDGSFNENCFAGVEKFADENDGTAVEAIKEPDVDKSIQAVENAAAKFDVLVLPGYNYAACADIAAANPDKYFILVDTAPTDSEGNEKTMDNIYSMTFSEQEAGFLAGLAAALETGTGKVAVVCGVEYPSNINYQDGFEKGVSYAAEHFGVKAECISLGSYSGKDETGTDIGGNYVGSFDDQQTGKELGNALIDEGVDIIFAAAGFSTNGVFEAAKEADGVFCIGSDTDRFDDGDNGEHNIILTSAMKIMDANIYAQLNRVKEGNFAGKNEILGIAQESIEIATKEGRHQMSDETVEAIDSVYKQLKEGSINIK